MWVNCFFVRDLGAPFGGNGKSGIGREGGTWSFDFYCDIKNSVFSPNGWTTALREDGRLMGEVVGAGLLAHVPTIMLPEATRRELNNGEDITLVAGLQQLRREVFETLDYDTVVVLDSHWATTVEFVVTAQDRRAGPVHLRGAAARHVPAALRLPRRPRAGARDRRARAPTHSTWITAIDDHYLPIFYATINVWEFLGEGLPDKRWISHRRLPDRRHRGQPAARPRPRRRDRRSPTARCC